MSSRPIYETLTPEEMKAVKVLLAKRQAEREAEFYRAKEQRGERVPVDWKNATKKKH